MEEIQISPEGKYNNSEWLQIIQKFNPEISSKAKYCRRYNITKDAFSYRQKKLLLARYKATSKESDFKELKINFTSANIKEASSKKFTTIVYPNGIKVEIPENIEPHKFAQLVINIQKVL